MPQAPISEKEALEVFQDFLRHKPGAQLEVQYDENQFVAKVRRRAGSVVDETAGTMKIDKKILKDILAEENFPDGLTALPLAFEIPADLLSSYHTLVRKKLEGGLTPEEEVELARVSEQLDQAELATPLSQYITAKAEREHAQRMAILDELITKLKTLQTSG